MNTAVRIARRFHGPPDSGNGGYVCGLVAQAFGGSGCTVTLHKPPPLETALELRSEADKAELLDGNDLVASGVREHDLALDVPPPPSLAEAQEAERQYVGHHRHRFPGCFTCGPEHYEGLRIFAGPLGAGQVAAQWTPAPDLADVSGTVRREFLWAAMDCPGYWAVEQAAGLALLGRMSARIEGTIAAGQTLIVTGWAIGSEGRKHRVGTALHDADGELIARAQATWITIGA